MGTIHLPLGCLQGGDLSAAPAAPVLLAAPASTWLPRAPIHTVDYDRFVQSQLAATQLTLGPYAVQIGSRTTRILGVPEARNEECTGPKGPERRARALGRACLNLFSGLGFRVYGLGFRPWGLGFGVWCLGFGVWGLWFRV